MTYVQGSISEISKYGDVTPQELRAIQMKREKVMRGRAQLAAVAGEIQKAVSKTNPEKLLSQGNIEGWHIEQAAAFLKELVPDADNWLDSDTIPVSMARLRKAAVEFANKALEVAANDTRVAELRSQMLQNINDRFELEILGVLQQVNPLMAQAASISVKTMADIHKMGR